MVMSREQRALWLSQHDNKSQPGVIPPRRRKNPWHVPFWGVHPEGMEEGLDWFGSLHTTLFGPFRANAIGCGYQGFSRYRGITPG